MSIVLQHIASGLYYHGFGSWTRELSGAFGFGHSQRAMEFVRQHRLSGVAVVVAFSDTAGVETHMFPIESPPQMAVVVTAG